MRLSNGRANGDDYDAAWAIDEGEAREFARRLAREEGLLAGPSSAMNVLGALRLARELGPERTVVTVAVDTGLKYVTGDLFGPTPSPEQSLIERTSD